MGIEIAEKTKKQESNNPAYWTHTDCYLASADIVYRNKEKTGAGIGL